MAKHAQTLFLEEWLKRNSDDGSDIISSRQSPSQPARAIIQAWADLRDSLQHQSFQPRHLQSLKSLLNTGISLYVADPQAKLLVSILSSPSLSLPHESYPLFLRLLYIWIPGVVFARGPAVAVLILLDSGAKTYVVLTEQVRVPVGKLILELPAGMLDDNKGDVVGAAIREVEEETGIQLNLDETVDLTGFLDPVTGCKVLPSSGGCDEELSLLLYRGNVSEEVITQLQGKETGLREHGGLIKVHVVPYEKLWHMTADAKALMAIALYEMANREGLLSPQ